MTKWEYTTTYVDLYSGLNTSSGRRLDRILNSFGLLEWEFCGSNANRRPNGSIAGMFIYFKRPIVSE